MRFPSFRRKLPLSSKILFGLAGSLAVFAFLLVQSETRRAERAQAATGPLATVVVAARDLSAGAAIGPDDVRLEQMPEVFLPPAAVPAAEAAVGLITAGPVGAGEVLVSTRLGASAFGLSVDPGHVAVTIGFASVPDGLTVADRVDAFATFGGARPYTSQVGEVSGSCRWHRPRRASTAPAPRRLRWTWIRKRRDCCCRRRQRARWGWPRAPPRQPCPQDRHRHRVRR